MIATFTESLRVQGRGSRAVNQDLTEELRRVIDRYLDGHRSRSLATLSRASGVSYTTIRRLYQREGNPTAEPVLKIVDAALTNDEKVQFINRHYPELGATISRFQAVATQSHGSHEVLKTFISRDPHNFVINLANNDKGATREQVQRLTGEKGLEALDELVEHDVLQPLKEGGRIVYRFPPLMTSDAEIVLVQASQAVKHFDRALIGTKAARLFHATASIDERTLERIHGVLTGAINEIMALKDDPRNTGNIPFYASMVMSVLDRSQLQDEGTLP